ncbi:hypothetical protein [uncultured Enterococcus sp.]|uniref:hypothetical protein n=1 Tax=uncultured Enterococcus sp. TaxID=167972 RepID=UPI002AA82F69|nr:hypothetical protein [uncultured Enterococcus sp.]
MEKHIGYHGTDKYKYELIKQHGFRTTAKSGKLPRDLGDGVYFFIQHNDLSDPVDNVKKYLKRYKSSFKEPSILEATCESDNVLNMNEASNAQWFISFKESNADLIFDEAKKMDRNNSLTRGNLDGLVIETLLRKINYFPDAIIKDTYTAFDPIPNYKISNFSNGRELCIRNIKIIKNICLIA